MTDDSFVLPFGFLSPGYREWQRQFEQSFDTTSRRLKLRQARSRAQNRDQRRLDALEQRVEELTILLRATFDVCAEKGVPLAEDVLARARQLAAQATAPGGVAGGKPIDGQADAGQVDAGRDADRGGPSS